MSTVPVIAVDGPSGVGKGTIAAHLAATLGYHLLDSGALYRILGCVALEKKLDINNGKLLAATAVQLNIQFGINGPDSVLVDGRDLSNEIRGEKGSEMASLMGAIPEVREALLGRQLAFRKLPGLVADGRDMGTVVFPDAIAKIFLTASPEERAKRRYKQLIAKGIGATLPDLLQDIKGRDKRDSNRSHSPLRPASDAHIIDTTKMGIDEVVSEVLEILARCAIPVSGYSS